MIKSITVTNPSGEELKMELAKPELSGLIVESIEGLGPPKANINSTQLATTDGSVYSSSRILERNIVISLIMMESPTIEASRQKTYKFFPIKKNVKLFVETDYRSVECYGYVESNEPDIFSDKESLTISIICTNPYFYDKDQTNIYFSRVIPGFEFPFSNESTDEKLLTMGELQNDTRKEIVYNGDIDTGMVITLHALDDVSKKVTIWNLDTRQSIVVDLSKITADTTPGLQNSEEIEISTVVQNKYAIYRNMNGQEFNCLNAIDKNSDWFQLYNGPQTILVYYEKDTTEEGSDIDAIDVTVSYKNAYGGI